MNATTTDLQRQIETNLRWIAQMQEEIRREGHAGWGNALDDIADTLLAVLLVLRAAR
jgi:hypothetical protein